MGIFSKIFKRFSGQYDNIAETEESNREPEPLYNYSIHAAVFLYDETTHRRLAMIGSGTDSILRVSKYVDQGARGSLSVKKLDNWSLSYQIFFSSNRELIDFVDEYFPGVLKKDLRKKVTHGGKYYIGSYDDT